MAPSVDREEGYILRLSDPAAAERVKAALRKRDQQPPELDVRFEVTSPRQGVFRIGIDSYSVELQDLPTIVECYKTYDDINLVKCIDIGQVLMVHDRGMQPEKGRVESRDGVTPPFHNARERMFRKLPEVAAPSVQKTEEAILAIAAGDAPTGVEFIDVEEEYVIDEHDSGSWQQLKVVS